MSTPRSYSEVIHEDSKFRVTKWTIEPGATIEMHTHEYDYVVVPISNNVMHVTTDAGELLEARMEPGTAYGRSAGSAHMNENRGDTDIVFIEVENLL